MGYGCIYTGEEEEKPWYLGEAVGENPGISNNNIVNGQRPDYESLVAHLVKNLPAMQETPVQFLGREDPLEK